MAAHGRAGKDAMENRGVSIGRVANDVASLRVWRAIGSIAMLGVGAVHLEQYQVAHFSEIPTIGTLFLVNFIAATAIGLVLLVPVRSPVGPRRRLLESVVALAGIGVAGGAFVALFVSEHTALFGFMEHGYRLEVVLALGAEAVAIIALALVLTCAHRRVRRAGGPGRQPTHDLCAAGSPRPIEA